MCILNVDEVLARKRAEEAKRACLDYLMADGTIDEAEAKAVLDNLLGVMVLSDVKGYLEGLEKANAQIKNAEAFIQSQENPSAEELNKPATI